MVIILFILFLGFIVSCALAYRDSLSGWGVDCKPIIREEDHE